VQLHKAFSVIRNHFGVLYSQDLRAALGLVRRQSIKKPIFRFRSFSKPDLKLLTDSESTRSCVRLFQRFSARREKKCRRQSWLHVCLTQVKPMWMWTYVNVNVKPINVFVVLSDNQIKRAVTSALYLRTKAQQVLKKAIVGAKQSIDNLWITVVAVEKKQSNIRGVWKTVKVAYRCYNITSI